MRIGVLAAHLGITPRALRHYEEQGLLNSQRAANGYRYYDEAAVTRAGNVKTLIDLGLTTEDIREYRDSGCLDRPLGQTPHCEGELGPIHARLDTLDELIARLQTARDRLRRHADDVAAALGRSDAA